MKEENSKDQVKIGALPLRGKKNRIRGLNYSNHLLNSPFFSSNHL